MYPHGGSSFIYMMSSMQSTAGVCVCVCVCVCVGGGGGGLVLPH